MAESGLSVPEREQMACLLFTGVSNIPHNILQCLQKAECQFTYHHMFIADLTHGEFPLTIYGDIDPAFIIKSAGVGACCNAVGVAVKHKTGCTGAVRDDQMLVDVKGLQYDL